MPRGAMAGLACAALVALAAAEARGERVAVIAVAADDPPVSPDALRAAVERALRARGATVVDDPRATARARRSRGPVGAGRPEALARVEALRDEGWRAYLSVRTAEAEAQLTAARAAALDLVDVDGAAVLIADVTLRLGAVALALGREAEAGGAFRLAATLAPGRVVTDAEFKPQVVAAYQAAQATPATPARVEIRSEPPGAAIEIDGVAAGAAPRSIELAAGPHLVEARAAARLPAARIVEVGAATEVTLTLADDPIARALAGELAIGDEASRTAEVVEAIVGNAGLDALWLVAPAWRRGAPGLLAQRCGGAPLVCSAVVELGFAGRRGLEAAARTLASLAPRADGGPTLAGDRRLIAGERRPAPRPVEPRRSRWRSAWLWIGLSAVTVGVTAVALAAGGDEVAPVVEIDPGQFGGASIRGR